MKVSKDSPATLPKTVIVLGFVSFFNDLASEMVTPLLPLMVATIVGGGPVALGLIEGLADAISCGLRLVVGRLSDIQGAGRKRFVLAGYTLSNLVRPLLGIATQWPHLAAFRGVDRIGKGIRSAPRDALIADVVDPRIRGRAYGFQRAMDNVGGMGGSLIAAGILGWAILDIPQLILWSAVPGGLGVLLVLFGVHEKPNPSDRSKQPEQPAQPAQPDRPAASSSGPKASLRWSLLSKETQRYLLVLTAFTFARASETFMVFRGHELAMSGAELLLLWSLMSLCKGVSSWQGGKLGDRIGYRRVLMVGWAAHALGLFGLGLVESDYGLWIAAAVFGLCAGLGQGVERAVVGKLAAKDQRGTAFGWYNLALGAAAIPAGAAFGKIWQLGGANVAFSAAAGLAMFCVFLFHVWVRNVDCPKAS